MFTLIKRSNESLKIPHVCPYPQLEMTPYICYSSLLFVLLREAQWELNNRENIFCRFTDFWLKNTFHSCIRCTAGSLRWT